MRRWLADLPLRWANAMMDANEHGKAVSVLRAARERGPKDARLTNNLIYAVQEWARAVYKKDGEEKARALLLQEIKKSADLVGLKGVAAGHAERVIRDFQEAGKHEEALAAVERNRDLFRDAAAAKALSASVFDDWARKLTRDKQWGKAVEVYEKGLKRLPGDNLLKTNLIYAIQEWVRDVNQTGGQEKARARLLTARFSQSRRGESAG